MSKIAVLTSGGDSPGMNTAVAAIARCAQLYDIPLIGIDRGYNGLLGKTPEKDFVRLTLENALDIADQAGTKLRTARCKEFEQLEVQQRAARILRDMDVSGLIVIGGNGSFMGAHALVKQGINCIGIPGTIDNDLAYTEMTLGYDTAVNVCVEAVRSIRATSRSHDRPHVVEVMGRHCGDIALMTAAATGAELVIAPEAGSWSVEEKARQLQRQIDEGNYRSTIVVAEGCWEKMEKFDLYGFLKSKDPKAHVHEDDAMDAHYFAKVLNYMCVMPDGGKPEPRATVLGYVQRGARPTARDAKFAFEAGIMAVNLLHHGQSDRAIGMRQGRIFHENITEALKEERPFDQQLYNMINML